MQGSLWGMQPLQSMRSVRSRRGYGLLRTASEDSVRMQPLRGRKGVQPLQPLLSSQGM